MVEDEVQHLEVRAEVMRTLGFSVIATSDPVETIAIVAQTTEAIDVAVVDYEMPVMNGCSLASRLKSLCRR